jgi:hypothetical protein
MYALKVKWAIYFTTLVTLSIVSLIKLCSALAAFVYLRENSEKSVFTKTFKGHKSCSFINAKH